MPNSKNVKISAGDSPAALDIMRKLDENPSMSQRDLAQELDISLGSVNYCLKALIDKGFVKAGNFSRSANKMGYMYLLTPKGLEEKTRLTYAFIKRKQAEYRQLKQEIEALQRELEHG